MSRVVLFGLIASLGGAGCSGSPATLTNSSGPPLQSSDAAVPSDDGSAPILSVDAAAPDAGTDAGTTPNASTFATGLGPAVVAHSAHFTLITKTGGEPGGAGVKSSSSFKIVSGVAAAGTK